MRLLAFVVAIATLSVIVPVIADADPKKPDVVTVHKEIDLTLHADTDFTPVQRAAIEEAASKWRDFSNGRVRLTIRFDLDFNSTSNLRAHKTAHDSVIIAIPEDAELVDMVDEQMNAGQGGAHRYHVLAFTFPPGGGIDPAIFVVTERIEPKHFRQVVQHELGHMIGLPDLPSVGEDIMSGSSRPGKNDAAEFTDADLALCRKARYCD